MNIFVPETGMMGLLEPPESMQWGFVREGVEQATLVLQQAGPDPVIHALIGKQLAVHARNHKWEVRKALAHTVLHLRHETFTEIVAILEKDVHVLVRNAVKRTLSRRSEMSKADSMKDQHGDRMLQWLEDLENKHGVMARNAAKRISEKLNAQFVKEMYHEMIRTLYPLNSTLRKIDASLKEGKRINREDLAGKIREAVERTKFLYSVLDALRSLTREMDREFQVESLSSLVEEAVHLVRDRKEEQSPLLADIQIDAAMTVEVNRHMMLQALTNIIQNSVEAYASSERTPEIMVTASAYNGSRIQLAITDYGCGMVKQMAEEAFLLFATSKVGGTGVGLALAQKIVESDHRGMISLESTPGQGTTVMIMLPKEQEGMRW
ncbi:MAG: HAMP domain-containing histidine kinase [Magnetococcales bacterium]|nr:HAMP domain-containing histidine kinase [Magnetococcales bacterium]